MDAITKFLILLIALQHLGFLYLEIFMWTKPLGRKIFGNTKEAAENTRVLAANQGLYNGFISAGLIWSLLHPDANFSHQITIFFLACIITAGIYGGITAKRSILYIQALPAIFTTSLIIMNI